MKQMGIEFAICVVVTILGLAWLWSVPVRTPKPAPPPVTGLTQEQADQLKFLYEREKSKEEFERKFHESMKAGKIPPLPGVKK